MLSRNILHCEHDLKQRVVAQRARGLKIPQQNLERSISMVQRTQNRLPDFTRRLLEAAFGFDSRTKQQRVDEEADDVFIRFPRAMSQRRADHDVGLCRIAEHEHLERC